MTKKLTVIISKTARTSPSNSEGKKSWSTNGCFDTFTWPLKSSSFIISGTSMRYSYADTIATYPIRVEITYKRHLGQGKDVPLPARFSTFILWALLQSILIGFLPPYSTSIKWSLEEALVEDTQPYYPSEFTSVQMDDSCGHQVPFGCGVALTH